jgi:hypothetical protein
MLYLNDGGVDSSDEAITVVDDPMVYRGQVEVCLVPKAEGGQRFVQVCKSDYPGT